MLNRCGCGAFCRPGADRCDDCRRRTCYGAVVEAIACDLGTDDGRAFRALDALADLMTDGARVRREHRREVNEIARDAQRDASGAFSEGRAEGLAEGRGPGW